MTPSPSYKVKQKMFVSGEETNNHQFFIFFKIFCKFIYFLSIRDIY